MRAGEGSHPREEFFEEDAEHEGALFVIQVRDTDNDDGRTSGFGCHPLADVEIGAFAPAGQRRGCEQGVERCRQVAALAFLDESVDGQGANLGDRWLDNVLHQAAEVGVEACCQSALGQHAQQHVLAALRRIGLAPEQPENERHGCGERIARGFGVGVPARRAPLERRQHV